MLCLTSIWLRWRHWFPRRGGGPGWLRPARNLLPDEGQLMTIKDSFVSEQPDHGLITTEDSFVWPVRAAAP